MGCILNEIAHRTFTLLLASNVAKFEDTHNFGTYFQRRPSITHQVKKKQTKRQTVLAARTDEAEYLAVALGASSLVKEMAAEPSVFLESCASLAFEFSIHSSNSSLLSSQVLTISALIISSVAWSAANDHRKILIMSYRQDVAR